MKQVIFRFYSELNDFLPARSRQVEILRAYEGRASVKDMIEAQGVPHTEVDLILVNGESVDFSYLVQPEDRISVYPVFESIDVSDVVRVRPAPLREIRFVLDTHLGTLAHYLRMLGFDTLYANDSTDEALAGVSRREMRILLTRDRGLLKRKEVTHGYYVRETRPRNQALEILRRFDLFNAVQPFHRCIQCNGSLEPVSKEQVLDRLPEKTQDYYDDFRACAACGKIYWKGSHFQHMEEFIASLLAEGARE